MGGKAQAGCKTRLESYQWSPSRERSLQKEDGRGPAKTVGSREKGEGGLVISVSVTPGAADAALVLFVAHTGESVEREDGFSSGL